jgi:hypothetical protein
MGRKSAKLRRSPLTAYWRAGKVTLRPPPLRRSQTEKPISFKPFGPLIGDADRPRLHRAAVILALADAIEARCPRGRAITVRCSVTSGVTVSVPQLRSWRAVDLDQRFERAFGKPLTVVTGA